MPKSPWEDEEFAKLSLSGIDERFLPGTGQEMGFLERELELPPQARIVDLGCGAGRHSIELTRRGHRVVGVDISLTLLEAAKRRAGEASVEIRFLHLNLADLGEGLGEEGPFDAAICLCESGLGVLGGEQQDLRFLSAVHGLLKPGGRFAITTFNALRRYRNPGSHFDHIRSVVRWQAPGGRPHEDQRLYSPSELSMMLLLSGFREVSVWACSPGSFARQPLRLDDIEMLLLACT